MSAYSPFRDRVSRFTLHALLPVIGLGLLALAAFLTTPVSSYAQGQQANQFAHPGFRAAWERTDGPVASGAIKRPWVWGPVAGRSLSEPFAGLPGNNHLVQYFDKGRMEINNPNGNPNDPFFVTNGLLAVELISGQMQVGMDRYERRAPALINLASDIDDPTAPTYQSFNGVANIPGAPNERRKTAAIGQVVRTAIDRQGVTQPWPAAHPDYGVRIAYYEQATGHNIPDVFWEYLNSEADLTIGGQPARGPFFNPWFAQTGYPISEPYWAYVKVAGQYRDVLVQAFERRVLTFVPHFTSPFKVQMGNIGAHYYDWRYLSRGAATPPPGPPRATPTSQTRPPLAEITIDEIAYRKSIVDLNGNYVVLTNRDDQAVVFTGWQLHAPKWGYVDRYYFPANFTLRPGASVRVHAGPGNNTAEDLYMGRTTVMWEGTPSDLAVLYDNFGREVTRFFPAAEAEVPPTPPAPPGTVVGTGTVRPGTTTTPARTGTPVGTVVRTATPGATSTAGLPSPEPTGIAPIGSPTPTTSGTRTATPQATTTGTRTPGTATATRTPTP